MFTKPITPFSMNNNIKQSIQLLAKLSITNKTFLVITRNYGHFTPAVTLTSFCSAHAHGSVSRWRTERGEEENQEITNHYTNSPRRIFIMWSKENGIGPNLRFSK